MLAAETISAFFIASVLLAFAPGPDNIFVLTQSALQGKLSGLMVVFGLCTGLLVHTGAVAFGVAVIFQASALAFTLLKFIGGGYLLYLAWHAFRASPEKINMHGGQEKAVGILYRRGIIMNLTNPKVSIFFLAFLPQFADPQRGPISLQMVVLGVIFIFATVAGFRYRRVDRWCPGRLAKPVRTRPEDHEPDRWNRLYRIGIEAGHCRALI